MIEVEVLAVKSGGLILKHIWFGYVGMSSLSEGKLQLNLAEPSQAHHELCFR